MHISIKCITEKPVHRDDTRIENDQSSQVRLAQYNVMCQNYIAHQAQAQTAVGIQAATLIALIAIQINIILDNLQAGLVSFITVSVLGICISKGCLKISTETMEDLKKESESIGSFENKFIKFGDSLQSKTPSESADNIQKYLKVCHKLMYVFLNANIIILLSVVFYTLTRVSSVGAVG